MMASVFSFFAAFHQKPMASSSSLEKLMMVDATAPKSQSQSQSQQEGRSLPPPQQAAGGDKPTPQQKKARRSPRFAPELDGVYCFETIIPSS